MLWNPSGKLSENGQFIVFEYLLKFRFLQGEAEHQTRQCSARDFLQCPAAYCGNHARRLEYAIDDLRLARCSVCQCQQ